jgi:23S rRNA (uridine2552-2'-O)-methyltransferase
MRRSASKHSRWSDHYTQRAKKEKYPARSVYKLQEIQSKFRLIKKGNRVLDLGCSPGSWLLFAAQLTTGSGQVVGVDLKPVSIQLPDHVSVYTGDILADPDSLTARIGTDYHVVLSDMAPATSGQKDMDASRSYHLCQAALATAERILLPGGRFVCKIFQGSEFENLSASVKQSFRQYKIFKPRSSRKASKEIYIIGMGKI